MVLLLYIYNANKPAGLEVGDEVRVKGYRAIYNGLQQIGSGATVTIENKGNVLPPLFNVTNISELTNSHQSLRISLDAIELSVKSQSGNNLVLTNGANDILIYAPSGSDIYNHIQSAVIGQKVLVHEAFVDWFNGLQLKIVEVEDLEFIEPSDEEKLAEVKADLVALYDEKSFNMDTAISLPIVGAYGVTIDWLLDPTDAIVEGKWKSVGTDGEIVLMTATLTLGDEEPVTVELQVNIVYVDETVPQGPVTIIDYTSTGNADLPNGWTSTGLGKDYSGSRLRFDDTGDNVVTNSLNILAGTVIEVTVEGNMNVGSGTGKGQLQILSGTTLLGTINLNTNPLTTYSIEITLSVSVEKLTFNFVKDNGNLGLGKIKVVTNPN